MRLIFMGTPEFAVPSLEALVDKGYPPVAVVTGPDRPRGRGQKVKPTPVKKASEQLGIEQILQPESVKRPGFAESVEKLEPDIIVVVAFKILPHDVYRHARIGAFNLHASLLPRYRGAAPINWAVIRGESVTGVTTFLLQPQVDRGDILLRERVNIGPDDTAGDVHDRLKEVGADLVVETVRRLEASDIEPIPQNDEEATSAPKIFQEDCRIPWSRAAQQVHNHIRGLSPYPGAWTLHDGTRLKIYRSKPAHSLEDNNAEPGEVISADEDLLVACGSGALRITKLQQPGRQRLGADAFLRGYPLEAGEQFT